MCGRSALSTPGDMVADQFGLPSVPALPPRYNVALAQLVAVIGLKPVGRTRGWRSSAGASCRTGPATRTRGRDPSTRRRSRSRSSSRSRKRSSRSAASSRPTGFYEWKAGGKRKTPYHFRPNDGGLFALAGVWDAWKGAGGPALLTCAIITVPANAVVKPVHERMPLMLPPAAWGRWLDTAAKLADLLPLLKTPPADGIEAVPVGPAVNEVANDGPECRTPAA